MWIKYNLFLITLFFLKISGFTQKTLDFKDDQEATLIGEFLEHYEDNSKELTFKGAYQKYQKGTFEKVKNKVYASPAVNSNHWFKFSIKPKITKDDLWINIFNQGLHYITLYRLDDQMNLVDSVVTGGELAQKTRQKDLETFWFKIKEKQDEKTSHFFLKIFSGGMMEVPILIGYETQLYELNAQNTYYAIFFIGAIFVMFFYNMILWYFTKDSVYFYYSGYIASIMFATTFANNFPIVLKLFGPYFTYNYVLLWTAPSIIFTCLFAIKYLQLRQLKKRALYFFRGLIIASSLVGIANFIIPTVYLSNVFLFLIATMAIGSIIISYSMWFKGIRRGKFYAVGWTFNFLSIIIFILVTNGFIEYGLLIRNVIYFGVLTELIVFSIALGERLNEFKKEQIELNLQLELINQRLIESNESLDSFNYHVSHDLKTVLNNSNALTRMVKKYNEKNQGEKVAEIADKLIIVTKEGAQTVHSFLSLGKVDTIFKNEQIKKLDIVEELNAVLDLHELSEKIAITIVTNELDFIELHKKTFESIFLNLITNSIKYNNKQPKAKIEFIKKPTEIEIIYSDNGIGIDLEKFKYKLFKPFQRTGDIGGKEGTGIGLYITKRIINNYGGKISVESELEKGTTFTFSIPLRIT